MYGDSEKIVIAHLEGRVQVSLTKGDVNGISTGYPPWYRETLTLLGSPPGIQIPSPISTYRDVNRAGWILGVGMSETPPLEAAHLSELFMTRPITRLRNILSDKLLPAFPQENVRVVIAAVDLMLAELTESGVFIKLFDASGNLVDLRKECEKFSQADATFAIAIFNSPPNISLTADEITKIQTILLQILSAAFRGSSFVVKALKNVCQSQYDWPEHVWRAMGLVDPGYYGWPTFLRDPKQTIYLEDCISGS